MQIAVVPLERRVRLEADLDVEIAGRASVQAGFALARQADAVVLIDARGNLHRQRLVSLDAAGTAAGGTWLGDDLPRAVALRARLLNREEALRHAHLALAVTGRARSGLRSRLRARAVTGRTLFQRGDA